MSQERSVLILNVNDEEASRYTMSRMLVRAGYAVIEARNGAEALALADREPDLVLLDVNLPDISGFEVCQKLRASPGTRNALVLHTSATYVNSESRVEGLTRGADAYLPQPFEPEELLATIAALLRQRAAASATHASACGWQATFDSIGMGLTFLDREGRIRGCNLAMSAILGLPADAVIGRSFEELVAEVFGLTELRPLRDIVRVRCRAASEIPLHGRWYLVAADPLVAPDGAINGIVLTWQDSTERKRLVSELEKRQQALLEADERKNEFLAMLAHELRNPLAAIATATHLLERAGEDKVRHGTLRHTITRQTRHLSRLIDDLLDVARVTRGEIHIQREPVDLRSVVEQALAACDTLLTTGKHTLAVSLPEGPCIVHGDPVRLEQIAMNLISNAAKYSEMGSCIEVTLTATKALDGAATARFSVRDSGIGMNVEDLGRVFELFFQADQSLARAQGGLGIGLTVVKRLVEMHGGRVLAESPGPGRGSTFTVLLPTSQVPLRAAAAHRDMEETRAYARVLVIEDNADGAEMTRTLLEEWGHSVEVAMDGLRGLEMAMQSSFDIALVDIGLPGLDGYEVARRLRANPDTRFMTLIAMSGYGRREDRAQARAAGFDAHLVKPLEFDRLSEVLDSWRAASERATSRAS